MTAHPEVSNCPADETLAAFIDDRLTGMERRAVIEHLAECGDCRSLVADTSEFRAAEAENVVRPRFGRRERWTAVTAAAAAIAASLAIVFMPQIRERFTPGIDDLVRAAERSQTRQIEGRLSGGFAHRRFDGPKRGTGAVRPGEANHALVGAAATVLSENKDDLHAAGVSHLVLQQRDDAVTSLRAALAKAEGDERSAAANDLAVALIARGAVTGETQYFEEALTVAEEALRTNRTPELLWNRALALQKLDRTAEAQNAWREYLQADPASPWAQEVRERFLRGAG